MSYGLDEVKIVYDWTRYIVSPSNKPFPAIMGERKHENIEDRVLQEDSTLRKLYYEYLESDEILNDYQNISNFFLLYGFVIVTAYDGDEFVYYCSESTKNKKNNGNGAEQYNYPSLDIYENDIKGNAEREKALRWVIKRRDNIEKDKEEGGKLDNSKTDIDYLE